MAPRPYVLLILAAAAYRTTVLAIDDRIPFGRLREWIWARWPYGDEPTGEPAERGYATRSWWGRRWVDRHRPALGRAASWWKNSWGERVRQRRTTSSFDGQPVILVGSTKIGYLFTCPWCMGVWHAAGWYVAWLRWPAGTLRWAALAAIAASVGLLYRIGNE